MRLHVKFYHIIHFKSWVITNSPSQFNISWEAVRTLERLRPYDSGTQHGLGRFKPVLFYPPWFSHSSLSALVLLNTNLPDSFGCACLEPTILFHD
jgi:hypothetical protein